MMSPIEQAFADLRPLGAAASPDVGRPDGPGWIAGDRLRDARRGPLLDLLERIAASLRTADRRTVAASFAMRFGWASGAAIGPFLRHRCVPDLALDNVSFRFGASGYFERAAVHTPRGLVVAGDPRAAHPSMARVADDAALVRALRDVLARQSGPVVDTVCDWSGFARRGAWGTLSATWVSQFTALYETPDDQRGLVPLLDAFFGGDDIVAITRPRLHAVTWAGATQLFQRRAGCCRYYLLPQGELCTSCPLVPDEERRRRNLAWMQSQASRRGLGGHA